MPLERVALRLQTTIDAARTLGYGSVATIVVGCFAVGFTLGYKVSSFEGSARDNDNAGKVYEMRKQVSEMQLQLNASDDALRAAKLEASEQSAKVATLERAVENGKTRLALFQSANKQNVDAYELLKKQNEEALAEVARLNVLLKTKSKAPQKDEFLDEINRVGLLEWGDSITLFDGSYIFRAHHPQSIADYGDCGFSLLKTGVASGAGSPAQTVASREMTAGDTYPLDINGKSLVLLFSGRSQNMDQPRGCQFKLKRR